METVKYARYSSPKIEGQKILYKGRRYWVIEMDKKLPFELCENICDAVVYDRVYGAVVVYVTYLKDGKLRGDMAYGQGTIDMYADNARDMASEVMRWEKWVEKEWNK